VDPDGFLDQELPFEDSLTLYSGPEFRHFYGGGLAQDIYRTALRRACGPQAAISYVVGQWEQAHCARVLSAPITEDDVLEVAQCYD
jgi:hypothetical protein